MSIVIGEGSTYDNDIESVRFLVESDEQSILDYYIKSVNEYWGIDATHATSVKDILRVCGDYLAKESTDVVLKAYENMKTNSKLRLLFNKIGYFSFNSYMYALFNDIYLVGVPSTNDCTYDGITTNGVDFMGHDIAHSWGMSFMDNSLLSTLATKYYKILRGKYTKQEKECMSLGVFMLVHEYSTELDVICDYDKLCDYIDLRTEEHNVDANNCMTELFDISYKHVLHKCNRLLNQ